MVTLCIRKGIGRGAEKLSEIGDHRACLVRWNLTWTLNFFLGVLGGMVDDMDYLRLRVATRESRGGLREMWRNVMGTVFCDYLFELGKGSTYSLVNVMM